jgi:hypothetical protein
LRTKIRILIAVRPSSRHQALREPLMMLDSAVERAPAV